MKTKITLLAAALALMAIATPTLAKNYWGPSVSLGGKLKGAPSVVAWGPNLENVSVFVRGLDDALWWNTIHLGSGKQESGNWQSIGVGTISSSPSCVASINSRINCYARGMDNALWVVTFQDTEIGKWGPWHSRGGSILGAPSATRWSLGHDVVFARGTNTNLYQIEFGYDGSTKYSPAYTGKFFSDGASLQTDPGCAAVAGDDFKDSLAGYTFNAACYAMGTPQLMFKFGSWYDKVGGTQKTWGAGDGQTQFPASAFYLGSRSSQDLFITGLAPGNTLRHRYWHAGDGWGKWEDLGGTPLASGPSCISTDTTTSAQSPRDQKVCVAQALDGAVTMRWYHPMVSPP